MNKLETILENAVLCGTNTNADVFLKSINVYDWYHKNFSNDTMGSEIDRKITFYDVAMSIYNKIDIYSFIKVNDSVVANRILKKLNNLIGNINCFELTSFWCSI